MIALDRPVQYNRRFHSTVSAQHAYIQMARWREFLDRDVGREPWSPARHALGTRHHAKWKEQAQLAIASSIGDSLASMTRRSYVRTWLEQYANPYIIIELIDRSVESIVAALDLERDIGPRDPLPPELVGDFFMLSDVYRSLLGKEDADTAMLRAWLST